MRVFMGLFPDVSPPCLPALLPLKDGESAHSTQGAGLGAAHGDSGVRSLCSLPSPLPARPASCLDVPWTPAGGPRHRSAVSAAFRRQMSWRRRVGRI